MINIKLILSFLALIYGGAQANSAEKEILSIPCSITEASTKTIENGVLSYRNWRGSAKTGDSINLSFRTVSGNGVEISFEPISLSTAKLYHIIYPENTETDGVNWIKSDNDLLKWNNLRIYRQGLTLHGIKSRSSIDLRYRSGNNWDGIVIADMLGDFSTNSLQTMAINCKLTPSKWHNLFDQIVRMAK